MLRLFVTYFQNFHSHLGPKLILVLGLSAFAGGLDGVSIMLLIPLLGIYLTKNHEDSSVVGSGVTDWLSSFGVTITFSEAVLVVGVLIIFRGIVTYVGLSLNAKCRAQYLGQLRTQIVKAALFSRQIINSGQEGGRLANLLSEQTSRATLGLYHFSQLATHTFNAVIYILLSLFLSIYATLMFAFVGIFIFLLFRLINRRVSFLSKNLVMANGNLSGSFTDVYSGKEYLAATNLFARLTPFLQKIIVNTKGLSEKIGKLSAITQSVREPAALLFLGLTVYLQLSVFDMEPTLLLVVIVMLYRAFTAIMGIQNYVQYSLEYLGGVDEIQRFLSECNDISLSGNREVYSGLNAVADRIILRGVSYELSDSTTPILSGVDLEIRKGTSLALVGRSGSGKSTLIKLMLGLRSPTSGSIEAADCDTGAAPALWGLGRVGYVPQKVVTFGDDIERNIEMNWSDVPADGDAIELVLEDVGLSALQDSAASKVDKKGINDLSGGERQRIALAREIFRRTDVLVVDEPTSALDPVTSRILAGVLKDYVGTGGTLIMATHNDYLASVCDRVAILEHGKVVEIGKTDDLKACPNSQYHLLFN